VAAFFSLDLGALGQAEPSSKPTKAATHQRSCMETARTQGELDACAESSAAEANTYLNKSYQALLKYLCSDEKAQLAASERAWIVFRDADCAFWGRGDGSIAPMNQAFCLADRSRERAKELDSWPPNNPRSDMIAGCK
jgi:uncharacterized protein YecT (DUF1311 family)